MGNIDGNKCWKARDWLDRFFGRQIEVSYVCRASRRELTWGIIKATEFSDYYRFLLVAPTMLLPTITSLLQDLTIINACVESVINTLKLCWWNGRNRRSENNNFINFANKTHVVTFEHVLYRWVFEIKILIEWNVVELRILRLMSTEEYYKFGQVNIKLFEFSTFHLTLRSARKCNLADTSPVMTHKPVIWI